MAPSLTPDQVDAYLDRIKVSQDVRSWLREGPEGANALMAVTILQHCHIANLQFENLDIVYSEHHTLPIETDFVIDTIINRRRGGTCAQIHQVFAALLRSFGFIAYCTGARINAAASILSIPGLDVSKVSYGPWVHLSTLVVIRDTTYVVDTNNGPWGGTNPIPLVHDEPSVDLWPRQRRMLHASLPGFSDTRQKWWRMQAKPTESSPWIDVYAFMDVEWAPVDFQLIRTAYNVMGTAWAAPRPVCFRVLLEEGEPVGYLMAFGDELVRHYKGNTETLEKFYSENERVAAYETHFGIALTDEEQKGIIGLEAELEGDGFDFYG